MYQKARVKLCIYLEAFVNLCDFHREQAWERWLKATHNEVGKDKAEVLILLRSIARSKTVEEFDIAKTKLQVTLNKWRIYMAIDREIYGFDNI